jgi:O-glycosyl hydrolase
VLLAGFELAPSTASLASPDITVDGSAKSQIIDGFGVNAIPKTWQGGALKPGIDLLVAQGSTLWRVDVDNGHSDWETTNANADPFTYNWTYYDALYSQPNFEDLWSELHYLNSVGITSIELSMSGLVPAWMSSGSGHDITNEDAFVQEVTSILIYARTNRGIQFKRVSALNEEDQGPQSPEGPLVPTAQYASIMNKLAARLDSQGLGDVKIVGPHTTSFNPDYTSAMLNDPTVMAHVTEFAYHNYGGCCTNTDPAVSRQTTLSSLPGTWSTGSTYANSPAAAYAAAP